ncbi:hypothetical protein NLG97_g3142 [Lecanicillium saksenae]|uniref:Uncharacterized protein n=1 Tax=Lecanicillium saksenae TaxID=468837 RepID=A0ACC1R1K6_9HYPO|nr:hypothetical protein NLG97_g3142 [Lecanicillium saksenae]
MASWRKERKGPAKQWGRLKPVQMDPLEEMGLPSKGETRLRNRKAQENYYKLIAERYLSFCSDAGERDELLRRFSSLGLESKKEDTYSIVIPDTASVESLQRPSNTKTLSIIMSALRKLREGIVASKRTDDFAIQAYLFCIRLAVLVKQPESYHAAILHLLRNIHPEQNLTLMEFQEVVAYLVLDTACRRRELSEAYSLRQKYGLNDKKVNDALSALAHDNFILFHRVRKAVDGHRARIMEFAEPDLRLHTLKCFGRAYLGVDLHYLEMATSSEWDDLKQKDGVGWELDGAKVVIRKIKTRTCFNITSSSTGMPPAKKKTKTSHQADKTPSVLLSDFRTAWPLQTGEETAMIKVKDEEFSVHRAVLTQHSEYFRAAAKTTYEESSGEIMFDNIDPKYFALFLGVAYSYSSIVPHGMPAPSANPEAQSQRTAMRDYVEVYKLCDRFICPSIAAYILRYIHTLVGDRHRALYRSPLDKAQQAWCTNDFADAFEALEQNHSQQKKLGVLMIEYFCEGVYPRSWDTSAEEMKTRPAFVLQVSRYFATKLGALMDSRSKLKRKELQMPASGE